jgi:hypothetical protein
MILTRQELELFTGKTERAQKRYGSQAAVLHKLGIPHLLRPDKTLIVFKIHVDGKTQKEVEPAPTVLL